MQIEAGAHQDAAWMDLPRNFPSWKKKAACRRVSQHWFFCPDSDLKEERLQEKNLPGVYVCKGCVVRQECLDYAMEFRISCGIWGGLTSAQRTRLRYKKR